MFDLAREGETTATSVIDYISSQLGFALANLANALNPEKIILGGGVSKAGDLLVEKIEQSFHQYLFPRTKKGVTILLATLGNDAGVIGAAYIAKTKLK